MKKHLSFLIFLFSISIIAQKKTTHTGNSEFQKEMNAKFKDIETSPLTIKDLRKFKKLDFFPIDKKYKVVAKITKTPNASVFKFPTSTSRIASYKKYGEVFFTIDTKEFKLNIYQDEKPSSNPKYKDYLFLPFLDNTNGKSSYSGGRFVETYTTDEQENGTILIDFNKAYNPYCAYSKRYSCPITPQDNYIDIEVKAGVMAYKK